MKKSQIDRAIALLEADRQPLLIKLDIINAAIEVLARTQAAKPAKKAPKPRPVRVVSEAAS